MEEIWVLDRGGELEGLGISVMSQTDGLVQDRYRAESETQICSFEA